MCVIAFALAGPLLSFLGRDSRTLCLFGPSRSGKTTAVLVAASVIGIARTGDLPTWNLTDARLEQQLALFNDSLFPIDDLTGIGGKARDAYQRIHDLAYRLHQGWGRGRHSTFAANNNSAREQWRVIGLTSSETSIRDLAQAAGCERQAGESVRLIDVPVLINGEDRLFDRAKNVTSRNASAAIVRQIVEAVSRQHGSVSRRHVLNIIEAGGKLTAADDIKKFCVSVRAHGDGNLTRDVAETFGFAFAAGCFAIRCRLVPWTERELLDAITTIYTGARELLPDEGVLLRSGLKALRGLMRNIRREAGQTERKVDFEFTKGIRKSSGSSSRYLIKGDAFNSIFATAREKTLVTRWLLRKGRLTAAGPGKVGNDARARPKDQIVWPDGKRRRSVELTWPRRLKRRRAR
jgi:hypothetical protein